MVFIRWKLNAIYQQRFINYNRFSIESSFFFFFFQTRANILETFDIRDRIKLDITKTIAFLQNNGISNWNETRDETSSSRIPLVDSNFNVLYV